MCKLVLSKLKNQLKNQFPSFDAIAWLPSFMVENFASKQ